MATEKIPCPVCNEAYAKGMNLSNHTRKRHGVNPDGTPFAKAEKAAPVSAMEVPVTMDGLRPGTIVGPENNPQKVPYTLNWLKQNYPMVTIIPDRTENVWFNGVGVRLIARRPNTVPSIFADIYNQAREEEMNLAPWRQQGDQVAVAIREGAGYIADTNVAA